MVLKWNHERSHTWRTRMFGNTRDDFHELKCNRRKNAFVLNRTFGKTSFKIFVRKENLWSGCLWANEEIQPSVGRRCLAVKDFIKRVRERGRSWSHRNLEPRPTNPKIVDEELTAILGSETQKSPKIPTITKYGRSSAGLVKQLCG